MDVCSKTCTCCGGRGIITNYVILDTNSDGSGTIKPEDIQCQCCDGKGYTEYPVFTIEEAKAILEHCGLSVED